MNMKMTLGKKIACAVLACGLLQTTSALAAGTDFTGKVLKVRVDSSGYGLIYFDVTADVAGATCRDAGNKRFLAFNTATEGGRGILQVALAAQLSGKQIHAVGTDTCTIFAGEIEDTARIYLQ
jgi:hypothetical protein